ncbi:MAG: hypothetical protein JWP13_309 [Candidatus Saccharibacteria bacterium]|nr:hypothetical protein [Candidatus Saccharibacteria bacterium]
MDEILLRQLVRQLRLLNIWISIVGSLILISLIVCIVLIFKVVTFVQDTSDKISNLQQKTENSLNVRNQLCDSKSIASLLEDRSSLCADR